MSGESQPRKAIDGAAMAIMIVSCVVWGLQQTAIKAVAAEVPPLLQVTIRSGGAALLVWLFSRLIARDRWLTGVALGPGLVVGALFAIEFLFVAEGLRWTTASHMAVFLYTAPVFAAIGLHLRLPDERLSRWQWVGIGLAFLGVVTAFLGPKPVGHASSPNWLLGDLLGLAAGAAWGLTTVAVRVSRLSEAPPAQTLFYQLAGAFVILLPATVASGQLRFQSTGLVWASLGFQTVVVCFVSYLVWFWLLRKYLAARLGVLSFMTPLFGVGFGAVLLREPLDRHFMTGAVFVLLGMVIVNGQKLFSRKSNKG